MVPTMVLVLHFLGNLMMLVTFRGFTDLCKFSLKYLQNHWPIFKWGLSLSCENSVYVPDTGPYLLQIFEQNYIYI